MPEPGLPVHKQHQVFKCGSSTSQCYPLECVQLHVPGRMGVFSATSGAPGWGPPHPRGSPVDARWDAPHFQLAPAHCQSRRNPRYSQEGKVTHRLRQICLVNSLHLSCFWKHGFVVMNVMAASVHIPSLYSSDNMLALLHSLPFLPAFFLASSSTSLFARAFIIIWSQVREPARPLCSRAVCFGPGSQSCLHFQQLVASSCVATLRNISHQGFCFFILPSISLFSPSLPLPESSKSFGKFWN